MHSTRPIALLVSLAALLVPVAAIAQGARLPAPNGRAVALSAVVKGVYVIAFWSGRWPARLVLGAAELEGVAGW